MEQIFITSATYQDVTDKVDIEHIQELLEEVELIPYSDQIKGINFVYIAVTDTTYHPEILEYDSEEQAINIHAQLDYEEVLNANEEETIILMKELFVTWIDRFPELEVDFDIELFKEDIMELFNLESEEEEQNL